MKKLTTALLTLLLALSLCACNLGTQNENPTEAPTEPSEPATSYLINFELNGGEAAEGFTDSVTVPLGETAKMPTPKKEGHVFAGWYLDSGLTNRYFFDYPLNGNATLYAKFYDTARNEYIVISNVDQLMAIKADPTAKYLLACDINCMGRTLLSVEEFTGELDGNGYKIHNFAMNENENNVALIRTNKGTVKNLSFDDFTYDIVRNAISNKYYGVICGINHGTVENCTIYDCRLNISVETNTAHAHTMYIGSFVGQNYGTVIKCNNKALINLTVTTGTNVVTPFVGGIVGCNEIGSKVEKCVNTGDLVIESSAGRNARNDIYSGGLVAVNNGTLLTSECTNDISAIATGAVRFWTGGAVGFDIGNITGCVTDGNITIESNGTTEDRIGGFVGYTSGVIKNCVSHGEIKVTNPGTGSNYYIGGFVGHTCGKLYNCYSTNNITDSTVSIKAVGGFAGYNEKLAGEDFLINKCFSTGSIVLYSAPVNVGSFVGLTTGTEQECYYLDSATIVQINVVDSVESRDPVTLTNDIGTGKAEAELLSVDFLENTLYFDRTAWLLVDGEFPVLR